MDIGNFFRALVDQEDHQNDFGMIRGNRVRHILQQHGFTSARRRNDQSALSFAERCQQIHDARAEILTHCFELDPLLRIKRRQIVEKNLVAGLFGRLEVDSFYLHQREILLALMRRPHLATDGVAGLQVKLANLRWRNVNVVRAGQIVVIRRAQKSVAIRKDFEHAFGEDVAFFFALRLQDLENQILFAHAAGTGKVKGASDFG